jgi:hypothetical protein
MYQVDDHFQQFLIMIFWLSFFLLSNWIVINILAALIMDAFSRYAHVYSRYAHVYSMCPGHFFAGFGQCSSSAVVVRNAAAAAACRQ